MITAVIYALFFVWYGSGGTPISREEAVNLLKSSGFSTESAELTAKRVLPQDGDDGRSFLMLNLVKQREFPDYGSRADLKPAWVRSGADADEHYASQFLPKVIKRAGHPVFVSRSVAALPIMYPGRTLDPSDQGDDAMPEAFSNWDYFALVRYRSMRDLLEAVAELTSELGSGAMQALKHSGVERTYVIPIYASAFSTFVLALVAVVMAITAEKIAAAMPT